MFLRAPAATEPSHSRVRRRISIGGLLFVITEYEPGARLRRHGHDFAKISLVLRGSASEGAAGRSESIGPGCVLLKPLGIEHEDHVGPDGLTIFSVRGAPSNDDAAADWRSALSDYRSVLGGPVVRRMHRMSVLFTPHTDSAMTGLDGEVLELVAALRRRWRAPVRSSPPGWLAGVRDRLQAEPTAALSLQELAAEVGVHPVYLARVFRRHLGCSVVEYVDGLRLRRAAAQVRATQRRLVDIALDAGYCDQAHFNRRFMRQFGMSPGRYRRLNAC